jgi:maltose O-acetyltransferase
MKFYIVNLILFFLPVSRCFAFKRALLRFAGVQVGKNVRVMRIRVQGVGLSIGEDSFIGDDTLIMGGTSHISIGKNCDISSRVNIISGTHAIGTIERAAGEGYAKDITIEDGVWVGFGATILAGVTIGKGSVIAAGSLVNKSIPSGVLAAGMPANVKRELYNAKS